MRFNPNQKIKIVTPSSFEPRTCSLRFWYTNCYTMESYCKIMGTCDTYAKSM